MNGNSEDFCINSKHAVATDFSMKPETFEDLLNPDFEWPQKGDRLGDEVDLFSHNVGELHAGSDHYGVFIQGYRNAANCVVEAVQNGNEIANFVCWPVLLLYRHAVELGLKECISWSSDALGEDVGIGKSEHRLSVLLDRLCDQSARLFPDGDANALAGFSGLVRELDCVDPTGQSFRYPVDKKGRPFNLGLEYIDLVKAKVAMDKVLNFLNGYAGAASNAAEIRSEMLSEMYQE